MAHAENIVSAPEFIHQTPISDTLAGFARALSWEDIPAPVIERAKLHILDALGIGLAASRYDYSHIFNHSFNIRNKYLYASG